MQKKLWLWTAMIIALGGISCKTREKAPASRLPTGDAMLTVENTCSSGTKNLLITTVGPDSNIAQTYSVLVTDLPWNHDLISGKYQFIIDCFNAMGSLTGSSEFCGKPGDARKNIEISAGANVLDLAACVKDSESNEGRFKVFASGMNIAWRDFGRDVGDGKANPAYFSTVFSDIARAGGNVARWWIHASGEASPQFDETGKVKGISSSMISDMKNVLDRAHDNKIGVIITLWSFDMISQETEKKVKGAAARHRNLISDESYRNAYLEKALKPMVRALKDHPGIHSWEIFNEPEGMSNEFGWEKTRPYHMPMRDIKAFINLAVGVIHREDPGALVTNGAWAFTSMMNGRGNINQYSDEQLIVAGQDRYGTLDYYQVHYYEWAKIELSPFHHNASHWQLDKPIIVGEFFMRDTFGVPSSKLYQTLVERGYAGALGWKYDESTKDLKSMLDGISDIAHDLAR